MDEITAAEIADEAAYAADIKTKCVRLGCGEKLPGTWEHFKVFGNYCKTCSGEMTMRARRACAIPRPRLFHGNQYTIRGTR